MSRMICNPLNLEYRYQLKQAFDNQTVFREAADPSILLFKDKYLLFASMSGGFWYSDDLVNWVFRETPELPIYDYAPDVRRIGGRVIFSASRRGTPCSFYANEDPLTMPFQEVATAFDFWDPALFQDDDGRVYFYWGCSNNEPIWGLEVDAQTFVPLGEKQALIAENEAMHGWERTGENNVREEPKTEMDKRIREYLGYKPFIEGAYMNKHQGRYYLQYAAPGTQYNVYADGVYVGDHPLGPFVYQPHNPFSAKPGGFLTGAGHGSTFQDKHGNWWHASTMRISVNENFERRIGLFPCAFDADGLLYAAQHFSDYPFTVPEAPIHNILRIEPELQLLSYAKVATASSSQPEHGPELGTDENACTWWAAEKSGDDQWYCLDLGKLATVSAVQVNFADHELLFPNPAPAGMHEEPFSKRLIMVDPQTTEYLLSYSENGETWHTLKDTRGQHMDLAHDFIVLDKPISMRYLKLSHMLMPFDGVPAVSGLRVFGKADGQPPAPVRGVTATREHRLNILLDWDPVPGADGYNVRYGIAPDKLYSSWQVYGVHHLNLSMVNADQSYYIVVDSFSAGGVTSGSAIFVP